MDVGQFNEERTELLDELIAGDVVNHDPLSDEALTAEGDEVAVRFVFEGTHERRFSGIGPSGRRISESNIALYRIEDGQIAEGWLETDNVELLEQLNAFEAPAQ